MSGIWRFLQMFGEGGGAAGGDGGGAAGAEGAAAQAPGAETGSTDVLYGRQDTGTEDGGPDEGEQQEQPRAKKPTFEELLKDPEYKSEFQKRFDKQFNKRFAEQKAQNEQQKKLAPALNLLAGKYGTAPGDIDALLEAIQGDNELIEQQAYDKGMEPEAYREYNRVMAENAQLKAAEAERQKQVQIEQTYQRWMQQAEQARQIYPGLDIRQEAKNPQFAQLLGAGIDVATAYQVVHMGELSTQLVRKTAQEVKAKTAQSMQANANRPRENGAQKTRAATIKSDPSKLSRNEFDDIIIRSMRGDKIRY